MTEAVTASGVRSKNPRALRCCSGRSGSPPRPRSPTTSATASGRIRRGRPPWSRRRLPRKWMRLRSSRERWKHARCLRDSAVESWWLRGLVLLTGHSSIQHSSDKRGEISCRRPISPPRLLQLPRRRRRRQDRLRGLRLHERERHVTRPTSATTASTTTATRSSTTRPTPAARTRAGRRRIRTATTASTTTATTRSTTRSTRTATPPARAPRARRLRRAVAAASAPSSRP